MYVSSIVVKHKEDGSSDMAWENRDKRKNEESLSAAESTMLRLLAEETC